MIQEIAGVEDGQALQEEELSTFGVYGFGVSVLRTSLRVTVRVLYEFLKVKVVFCKSPLKGFYPRV